MTTVLDRQSPTVSNRPTSHLVAAAALFAGVTVAVAVLGSVATSSGRPWYDDLAKPAFNPPDATFGIVWTILYVMIALAGWLAWRATDDPSPTIAWFVQMVLNLGWTVVFFGWRAPEAAIVVIAALIVAVAVDLRLSWRASAAAGALLVPYFAWVCFAAALNIGVAVLN
jgi:tryptophan-rich sensory protein